MYLYQLYSTILPGIYEICTIYYSKPFFSNVVGQTGPHTSSLSRWTLSASILHLDPCPHFLLLAYTAHSTPYASSDINVPTSRVRGGQGAIPKWCVGEWQNPTILAGVKIHFHSQFIKTIGGGVPILRSSGSGSGKHNFFKRAGLGVPPGPLCTAELSPELVAG